MGNKISNRENIILNELQNIKTNIVCPKCPLTPIINITETKEGTLVCEYRCPSLHMGIVKIEEMISNFSKKSKKHGLFCDKCKIKNTNIKNKFKYCGKCKSFLCDTCIKEHNLKLNHLILNISKMHNTCLFHGNKYKYYCFHCLRSLCSKCLGHENHSFKELKDMEPNDNFFELINYHLNDVDNYFNSVEKNKPNDVDQEYFREFKKRNILLLNFFKDLYRLYLERKENNSLNGEIIINLLYLSKFNFDTKNLYINADLYLKTHLIIKYTPVSKICSFTNIKANYKIGDLTPVFFKDLNIENDKFMNVIRMDYDFIAYNIEKMLYFMKNEENIYFKVEVQDKIKYFFQLKEHIICICCENNVYFYKLMNIKPYIIPVYVFLPKINNIVQVYGNIYQDLFILNEELNLYELIIQIKDNKFQNYDIYLQIIKYVNITNLRRYCCSHSYPDYYVGNNSYENNDSNDKSSNDNNDNNSNDNNDKSSNENIDNNNNNNNDNNSNDNNDDNSNDSNDDNSNGNNDNNSNDNNDNNSNNNNNNDNNSNVNNENNINDNNSIYKNSEKSSNKNSKCNSIISNLIGYQQFSKKYKINSFNYNLKKKNLYLIKGLVFNYIILKQDNYIYIRDKDYLSVNNKMFFDDNFIVHNCHILLPVDKYIYFYSIPDLLLVSAIQVTEQIYSFVIPNKNTLLLIGKKSIEQLELNTWNKISKLYFDDDSFKFSDKKTTIIGNNNELYLFKSGEIFIFKKICKK